MGVPHRGCNWVSLAKNLSALALGRADQQVLNALDVNSETLERLMADFAIILKENTFKLHTFQETKDIVGIPGLKGLVGIIGIINSFLLTYLWTRSLSLSLVSLVMLANRFKH
jgi:hypothetical protein